MYEWLWVFLSLSEIDALVVLLLFHFTIWGFSLPCFTGAMLIALKVAYYLAQLSLRERGGLFWSDWSKSRKTMEERVLLWIHRRWFPEKELKEKFWAKKKTRGKKELSGVSVTGQVHWVSSVIVWMWGWNGIDRKYAIGQITQLKECLHFLNRL